MSRTIPRGVKHYVQENYLGDIHGNDERKPGGNNASPPFEVTAGFLADADSPPPKKGINPGEWLTIIFDLQSNQTVNDVASQLGNGALRIGMHVTGYESGGAESFVNIETPAPAAIWLFLSALPMFFARRYRKKK